MSGVGPRVDRVVGPRREIRGQGDVVIAGRERADVLVDAFDEILLGGESAAAGGGDGDLDGVADVDAGEQVPVRRGARVGGVEAAERDLGDPVAGLRVVCDVVVARTGGSRSRRWCGWSRSVSPSRIGRFEADQERMPYVLTLTVSMTRRPGIASSGTPASVAVAVLMIFDTPRWKPSARTCAVSVGAALTVAPSPAFQSW